MGFNIIESVFGFKSGTWLSFQWMDDALYASFIVIRNGVFGQVKVSAWLVKFNEFLILL